MLGCPETVVNTTAVDIGWRQESCSVDHAGFKHGRQKRTTCNYQFSYCRVVSAVDYRGALPYAALQKSRTSIHKYQEEFTMPSFKNAQTKTQLPFESYGSQLQLKHCVQAFQLSIMTLTVKGFAVAWSSLLEIIFAFFLVSLKRSIDGGFINIT